MYRHLYVNLRNKNHLNYTISYGKENNRGTRRSATRQRTSILQAADALIKGTRAEEGNISYNLYQNPSQPVAFIFYEEYKDQHAMDVHAASPHFQTFGEAIKGVLASDLIIETF